ncbi:MAG: hypothetical protein ACRD50_16625 [Candidatus Acidiferrales bacterium]
MKRFLLTAVALLSIAALLSAQSNFSSPLAVSQSTAAAASAPWEMISSDGTRNMVCTSRVNINQTASSQLISGTSSQKIYLCSVFLISATAQNVELVEGTATTCGTGTAGLWGGATAATGPNLAANMGFVIASSTYTNFTATAADNLCLLQSGSGQVSGYLTYISQ